MHPLLLSLVVVSAPGPEPTCNAQKDWVLVAHGGAGAWQGTQAHLDRRKAVLGSALAAGASRLEEGATAVDVVELVIVRLEDAPELNAGRGGIPNREGFVELDAAIMRGRDLAAGTVAGLRVVKNPIRLARVVMEQTHHVMFVDRGAVELARSKGLDIVKPDYFLVASRKNTKSKSGTVGAVVLDRCGEIASGTSTGGYDSKIPGRVGDVPIIGAGTYANHKTAAISATGWGEWFIRYTAAHDVSALMEYRGLSVKEALKIVLAKLQKPGGATGGFIAVTPDGTWATHHTSKGMLRGVVTHRSPRPRVGIFKQLRAQ